MTDPNLLGFLHAPSRAEADRELARLMERADRLVTGYLRRHRPTGAPDDTEDAISEARSQLMLRLQGLRRESRCADDPAGASAIADFDAYAITVARVSRAQSVRRRHPARAMLLNRLRYLLEGRTNQRGFALWTGPGGELWAGFEAWRERDSPTGAAAENRGRLLADPRAVAAEIFGAGGVETALPLAQLVAGLCSWLGGPLRLRDLLDAVAEWQGVHAGRGEALVIDDMDERAAALPHSQAASPHEALRWKEYLLWLLRAVAGLSPRQRSAFLLHSTCLRELEILGLIGVRQAAALLEIPSERLAEHWTKLPLDDRAIGAILGAEPQQVINLRKVARGTLGRAWQHFLRDN